jgi:hypothetical protein
MDASAILDQIEEAYAKNDAVTAQTLLAEMIGKVSLEPVPARAVVVESIANRLGRLHPQVAAHLALGAGALVESGVPAAVLGDAILDPLERILAEASRLVDHLDAVEDSSDDDAIPIGRRAIARADLDAIADDDYRSVASFFSLETWYRPAVAAWTRDKASLIEFTKRPRMRKALADLGDSSDGSFWLSILIETTIEERFVFLFPELDEAFEAVLDGVVDCGQLAVLASEALADPLARIGAGGVASEEALAVMRGVGAQQDPNAVFSAAFHFYPWNAINPETRLPEDERITWSAPGGTGTHSLPPDFLPNTLEPLDGRRILAVVGPSAPGGVRFTRAIGATRMFAALRAGIGAVRKLSAEEAKQVYDTVLRVVSDG